MKRTKRYFNMVEVALAIAVVGLGIAGIMSLFPVALRASKNAVGDNYASSTADELLHYLGSKSEANWDTFIGTLGNSYNDGYFKDASNASAITDDDRADTNWNQASYGLTGTNLYVDDNISGHDVWGIKQSSGNVEDFKAHMKLWKSQVTSRYRTGAGGTGTITTPYGRAAALNIEVSWPVGKPYSQREKRYFYYEIHKPN